MSQRTLAARLQYAGGDQLGRINKQKLRSLKTALTNDYNSRLLETPNDDVWRGLINTNNLKPDYDKKILSIEFDSQLEAGDVFELLDDHTHWMVYLPILTETAYLRAEIIRCRYKMDINGEDYWFYFQGPTETDLRWGMKKNTVFNSLNLSGTIYIKDTPETRNFFHRFKIVKIAGHNWEIQVTDYISVPGILELEVQEFFDNTPADLPTVTEEDPQAEIIGKTVVKQSQEYGYEIREDLFKPDWIWEVANNPRVFLKDTYSEGRIAKVEIADGAVRTFQLIYKHPDNGEKYTLDISIDYTKSPIQGPDKVYPYDHVKYFTKQDGEFLLDNTKKAIITNQTKRSCEIDIVTGKKGTFDLLFIPAGTGSEYRLTVSIGSL